MWPLFLLFVVLPIAEIMLLINVSDSIGGWNTFFIVLITAFFGAYFVRQQGFMLVQQIQGKLHGGQAPSTEMAEGLLLLVAGVLLITPGFMTDILGFLFTLPFSRGPIARFVMQRVIVKQGGQANFTAGGFQQHSRPHFNQDNDNGDIIDAEFSVKSSQSDNNEDKNRLN